MLNVLVTGGKGQLGSELKVAHRTFPNIKLTLIDKEELDLSDFKLAKAFFEENAYDYIVNCAAYTAVDKAEDDVHLAYQLNGELPKLLAEICLQKQIKLIHISTDYVFSGDGNQPLTEESSTDPKSVYGKSKLEGEKHIQKVLKNHFIFRTSWLYSSFGNNFVKTILKLAIERDELGIVSDQIGTPTYAADLANEILSVISKESKEYGVYHFSNEGAASWYDFAHFFVTKKKLSCNIIPILTKEYPTKAPRPMFSLMSKGKLKAKLGDQPRHWSSALSEALELID